MHGVRPNTLVVDFSVLPIRPEIGKVQCFLENEINLQYADVRSIQLHHIRNCVLIEMASSEIVCRYQAEHNLKRTMRCSNKDFHIPVYLDGDAVTVRVLDLPPSISNAAVSEFMLKYGEVISIRDEYWRQYFPGMINGVRVLRMNLFRDIPPIITVHNERTMVSYSNQPKSSDQPFLPSKRASDSNSSRIPSAASPTPATASADGIFNHTEFPPLNSHQQKSPHLVSGAQSTASMTEGGKQNDDDWTDIDDNGSNSSTDYSVVTHKRRRSKKQEAVETKKVCNDQCFPNTDHTGERAIDNQSNKKVFSSKNRKHNVNCNVYN